MSETEVLPELKQILGALLFAAKGTVSLSEVRRCLRQVAEDRGGVYRDFSEVAEKDIVAALDQLRDQLRESHFGMHINELAGGYRMENDANCGPWLRELLHKGRANRLSRPALETLAVIAYRQPCTRAEIEAVRGVAVDQILRNLIDLQLIRITGRSEMPGRPWQFGTTQKFLEYFGLNHVKELPGVEELRRIEAEQEAQKAKAGTEAVMEPDEELAEATSTEAPATEEMEETEPGEDGAEHGGTESDASDDAAEDEDAAESDEDDDEYDDDEYEDDEDDDDDEEGGEDDEEESDDKED